MRVMIILILIFSEIINAQNNVSLFELDIHNVNNSTETITEMSATPFELIDGMIVVEAEINKKRGHFILDTGAPLMIVNAKSSPQANVAAKGISEAFWVKEIKIKSFEWAGLRTEEIDAIQMDISHLEKATDRTLLGLIGYDMLKDFEMLIDYENHIIRFFNAKKNDLHDNFSPSTSVPFIIENHLPIIKVKIGKKKLYFGLDTGAEVNLIDLSIKDKIDETLLSPLQIEEIQGVDKVVHEVFATHVSSTTVKDLDFDDMKYLFTDMSHLRDNSTFQLDGLLGFPFFSQRKCSINYKKKRIYFWQ